MYCTILIMDIKIMKTELTKNIGDVFQCIAAMQFIECEDPQYIDREELGKNMNKASKIILNGWYIHDSKYWPPSRNLKPLFTSMHISNVRQKNGQIPIYEMILSKKGEYLKDKNIGCRDTFIYNYLKKKNMKAYFSGCMTLTLNNRQFGTKVDDGYICLVDCSDKIYQFIKEQTNRKIIRISQEGDEWYLPYEERLKKAKELLQLYNNAHLVISGRLHVILPCLAIETPVIRIEPQYGDERYEGIGDLVYSCTEKELITKKFPLNLENLKENPKEYKIIRKNLKKIVKNYINDVEMDDIFYENIHKENIEAIHRAKKLQIEFRRKNKMTPYFVRQNMYNLRKYIRNKKNHI